jgi:CBS domain-containing protein
VKRKIIPDVTAPHAAIMARPTHTAREAARLMTEHKLGAIMVGEESMLQGIFTERDLMTKVVAAGRDPDSVRIADVMTRNPDTISPDETARGALEQMNRKNYRHLPVVDQGKLVAIVSARDVYAALLRELAEDLDDHQIALFRPI